MVAPDWWPLGRGSGLAWPGLGLSLTAFLHQSVVGFLF